MDNLQVWILTFERPIALNRLIQHFGEQGQQVKVFSNSPMYSILDENWKYVDQVVVNSLNSRESNAWCARSWNSIYMKAFNDVDRVICIQDDTDISPNFMKWWFLAKDVNNFMSGPAGDQFHYITRQVFEIVGWWDERYIGCYCADADYFKRVFMEYDRNWISIEDTHNWGTRWRPCGITENVITTFESKTVDPNYDNQHWALAKIRHDNPTLFHSQQHYKNKWGIDLDNNRSFIEHLDRKMPEIDWYPALSNKFGVIAYD